VRSVARSCPCYWVDPEGAFLLGIGAGVVVVWGIDLLEYLCESTTRSVRSRFI